MGVEREGEQDISGEEARWEGSHEKADTVDREEDQERRQIGWKRPSAQFVSGTIRRRVATSQWSTMRIHRQLLRGRGFALVLGTPCHCPRVSRSRSHRLRISVMVLTPGETQWCFPCFYETALPVSGFIVPSAIRL